MKIKKICPYCGGHCETTGGPDGDPFHKNRKEKSVCTACGRTTPESEPLRISDADLKELLMDTDIIDRDVTDTDMSGIDVTDIDMTISDITNVTDTLKLKISATAEGGGVQRTAETTVSIEDGSYSLGNEYPFGRCDSDRKPPFSLCSIVVKGNEISIAGETFRIRELPKTITKKLTAYGYGSVPWEENITIKICFE